MTSGVPLLAASFASKFDTIGPYVGFASLIAVVAMAILVFSQGRELQRLREWAGTSPERLEALEEEIRARAYGGAPPQAQGAGPARPGTLARHPGAVAAGVAGAGAPPGAPVTAGATATPPPPGSPVTGASTTADGAAVPPGGPRPVPPRPTPPGGPGATRILPAASAAGGPRAATPAGMAASTAREREAADGGSRRSIGQIVGVGAVVLVVLVALLFAFGVIGGDGGKKSVENANRQDPIANPEKPGRKPAPRYSKTQTRVTVLNGSGVSGRAKIVSDEIDQKLRFPMGEPSNFLVNGSAPTAMPTTVVYYATGQGQSANRAAAQDIAKGLGLKTTSAVVKAVSPDAKANAPQAKVIVVVGQDLAAKFADEPTGTGGTGDTGSGGTSGTSGGTGSGTGANTSGGSSGTSGTTTPGTDSGTGDTSAPVDPAAGTAATPDGTADSTGAAGGGTTP